jgi:hypothetical protein
VLVSHRDDVFSRVLADLLRVVCLDMRLDVLDECVVGLAFDVDAARAVDDLHVSLLDRGTKWRLLRAARRLRLLRLRGLLALQADPVAPIWRITCAQVCGHHRHAAARADRRTIVVHGHSMF